MAEVEGLTPLFEPGARLESAPTVFETVAEEEAEEAEEAEVVPLTR